MTFARKTALMKTVGVALGLALLWALVGAYTNAQIAEANNNVSKKTAAAGGTTQVFSPGERVVLLREQIRSSKITDLILGVSAECSIVTDVVTAGNDSETSGAQVRIWTEIDGIPVTVEDSDGTYLTPEEGQDGKVVFCNRVHLQQTAFFDDQDASIRTFQDTRSANAFTWMALNVDMSPKIHTIEVLADLELTSEQTTSSVSRAVVGNRTLVIEPVKAAKDEVVTDLDGDD